MLTFTVRLDDIAGCDTQQLIEEFLQKHNECFQRYVVCHEIAQVTKKPHYQGWIEVDAARSSWQKWIQMFPHKGTQKSFELMKKEEYRAYVVKDGDIRYQKGVTEAEIKEWREKSFTKEECEKKIKDKRPSNYEAITEYVTRMMEESSERPDGWKIAKWIILWYQKHSKCEPNDYQIRNMSKSIWTKIKSKGDSHAYQKFLDDRAMQIIGPEWIH